ncbi:hypothetical protein [Hymenobacter glacieicola]|uniref:Uncharacterized protein n=1 Tax=Hymenobacter glacieicola TaxID=1562124 RepID=A0ABQ1X9M7_9BACT|nr:hypothetical protein [Hymenobacter glacieicola]GGG60667.1 hypothetical protein GCM10011378_40860 [Hymenobacter glacieicola]
MSLTPRTKLTILAALMVLSSVFFLRSCYVAGELNQAVKTNPPLSTKAAKKLRGQVQQLKAKGQADSTRSARQLSIYQRQIAQVASYQAAADAARTRYETIPSADSLSVPRLTGLLSTYRPAPP